MSEQEIHDICEELFIKEYTINTDGSIDVDGNVYISNLDLSKLPLKFNIVHGSFDCSYNNLTTLDGSPKVVGGFFSVSYNKLTSLEGSPKEVGIKLYCTGNPLTTLNGFNLPYDKLVYYLFNKNKLNILIKKHRRNRFIKHIVSDQ